MNITINMVNINIVNQLSKEELRHKEMIRRANFLAKLRADRFMDELKEKMSKTK